MAIFILLVLAAALTWGGAARAPRYLRGDPDNVHRIPLPWPLARTRLGPKEGRVAADFVRLVQELAALLSAGRSVTAVWDAELQRGGHLPAHAEFLAAAQTAAHSGIPVSNALTAHTVRIETEPAQRSRWLELAACLAVAESSGAPVAAVLHKYASTLEDEIDAAAERDTAMAGPRSTVRILACLPILGLLLGLMMGADPLKVFVSGPLGWGIAAAGGGLMIAGHAWSSHLVRSAARDHP